MPKVGERLLDRYEIDGILGVGGFAVVYRARDTRLGGDVAIKVLEPGKSLDPQYVERFKIEINLVRQLHGHNTIKIWDAGETEAGCLFMATEFVKGEALETMLKRDGKMPMARVLRIASQVLRSLAEAHAKGIVHRDLKPANIMVSQLEAEKDYVKVLDFGIAKAVGDEFGGVQTQTGLVMCTPKYASPEILRTNDVTPAADIYSLGLIMIEMLTGQAAVRGDTTADIIAAQVSSNPVPIPPEAAGTELGRIVAKATAKPRRKRYADAGEMLDDVVALPALEGVEASGWRPTSRARRRARALWVLGASALLAVGALAVFLAIGPGGRQGADDGGAAAEDVAAEHLSADSVARRAPAEGVASDTPAPRPERAGAGTTADDALSAEPGPGEPAAAQRGAAAAEAAAAVASDVAASEASGEPTGERADDEGGATEAGDETSGAVAAGDPEREAEAGEAPPSTGATESALHRARLRIVSEPEGAEIWLGDDRIGHTPFDGEIESASGTAELSVRAHGYRSWHETAVLAGEPLEYEIALRRRAPEVSDDEGEAGTDSAADEGEGEEPAEVDPFGLTQTY